MMGMKHVRGTATAMVAIAGVFGATAAMAGTNVQSGTRNGVTWEARSRIIGQTPTGTGTAPNNGPGDPIYLGTAAQYRGTVGMLVDFGPDADGAPQRFVCSGSLLNDRRSIATAAHCVSGGAGTRNPLSTTVFFYDGTDTNASVYASGTPGVTTRSVSDYFVNSRYTGQVIDQNDIAVLRLADVAPAFANSYELHTGDLTGQNFNVAGYGNRSATGGADGYTGAGAGQGTGRLRQGDNTYDFRFGDSAFNGFWKQPNPQRPGSTNFFGTADIDFSYMADFDNGLSLNDASCRIAAVTVPNVADRARFCNTGLGAREVGIAGGDSGGPGFVNGQLASINSYGLSFGTGFGDVNGTLNGSWGEFAGYVPVSSHRDFIMGSMVPTQEAPIPEPSTWAQLLLGFGVLGYAARRRRVRVAVAA
jgi:hypothetical protein